MSIVIKNGETLTLTGGQTLDNGNQDINGDTFIVQGNGTLKLGHDANGANITIADAQVTVNLAHDLNSNATVTDDGGVFTVGHDANGAKFNISNGGEVELSHAYSGATFALSGQNDEIVFGINNNPVRGGSLNNQITGLNAGDKIELNGQTFSSATFNGNTITLSNGFKLTNVSFASGSLTTLIAGVDPATGFDFVLKSSGSQCQYSREGE
jgi:hypothetical protein